MATRKSIYFSNELDGDILEHIEKLNNFSGYIKRLILKDINGITNVIRTETEESFASNTKVIPQDNAPQQALAESHISNTPHSKEKATQQPKPNRERKIPGKGKTISGASGESKPKVITPPQNDIRERLENRKFSK